MNSLHKIVGLEQFRPKIDVIKNLLQDDVKYLEGTVKKVIVIAGTNGKGETAHNLRYLLNECGQSTALWTSPHVLTICERMLIGDVPISYSELASLIESNKHIAISEQLSFYEFLFYLFIKHIVKNPPDYLILEVGLGGRFDAVNIFTSPLCAICSISRDHTQILGNDLKSILFEKYGIVRKMSTLYSGVEQVYLQDILNKWSTRDEVNFHDISIDDNYCVKNQKMSLKLLSELGLAIKEEKIMWPVSKGRREKVTFLSRNFIFIGAHNLDGHRKMLKMLEKSNTMHVDNDIVLLSFSTGREDQIESIISLYEKSYPCLFGEKFLSEFSSQRSINLSDLKKYNTGNFLPLTDWNLVFNDSYKNKNIFIVGSYFFISDFQRYISKFNFSL